MDLFQEITRCPNIQKCFTSQSSTPCSKIISVQHSDTLDLHQVPEPWSGNIQQAPILFLSSNPSIDEQEEYPLWCWPDQWIEDFFVNRFSGGRKQWIEDGMRNLQRNGSPKLVHFWIEVRQRAKELLERDVKPGSDYALTEVVHCKSRKETGVKEALQMCTKLYLQPVVALSGAKVIIVLGKQAAKAVRNEFRIPDGRIFGPLEIGKRQRYIVFLPHPNARVPRTFEKCFNKEKLQELRAFLWRD